MSALDPQSRYDIEKSLAKGGMGEVLEARDMHFGRSVAMKVIRGDLDAGFRELRLRFVQEARILSQLEHPNIVPVYDLDKDDQGRVFYTMKKVEGDTLDEIIKRLKIGDTETVEKYSLSQLLTTFQKICNAVAFAHSKGIIHRDLKPENIMLGSFGEVLVMDWGLAKALSDAWNEERGIGNQDSPDSEDSSTESEAGFQALDHLSGDSALTMDGQVMGTPQFMAPEQAAGEIASIDERTDVFSLGAILYSLLTLRPPTGGSSVGEVLDKVKSGLIAPPVTYNRYRKRSADGTELSEPVDLLHCPGHRIPDALSAVAMKAMENAPEARYQSVQELQEEISAFQGGFATGAEEAGRMRRSTLWVRRNKTLTGLLFLASVFIAYIAFANARMRVTIANLHATAPTYYDQARSLAQEQEFEMALDKVDFAVALRPDEPRYHALKGDLLQALFRLPDAQQAYQQALALAPDDSQTSVSLQITSEAAQQTASKGGLSEKMLFTLQTNAQQQGRAAEALVFSRKLSGVQGNRAARARDRAARSRELARVMREKLKAEAVNQEKIDSVRIEGNGRAFVDVAQANLSSLDFLAGFPIETLIANGNAIRDLSPLRGMPLRRLELGNTRVDDISPLKGMQLKELNLQIAKVSDISALRGMPIQRLALEGLKIAVFSPIEGMPLTTFRASGFDDLSLLESATNLVDFLSTSAPNLRDLSPLRGRKLRYLFVSYTGITDLQPLRGMPLRHLEMRGCKVTDLSPLAGMPLKDLNLDGCDQIKDISPLVQCKNLQRLVLPLSVQNLEPLRDHPRLKQLAYIGNWHGAWSKVPPIEDFWKRYDAAKRQNRK